MYAQYFLFSIVHIDEKRGKAHFDVEKATVMC